MFGPSIAKEIFLLKICKMYSFLNVGA
ncbi:hypothetical protein Gotur_027408 [Gossypium turneri]